MILSAHRKHKIYILAIMGYGLSLEAPKEVDYYQQIKKEMKKNSEKRNMGIARRN